MSVNCDSFSLFSSSNFFNFLSNDSICKVSIEDLISSLNSISNALSNNI